MKDIIKVDKLSKAFYKKNEEIKAIDDISFDIYDGEFLVLVGPSGCGKSSFLNILGGLTKESSGHIYKNENVKIGYMLQDDCLFSWLSVLDNCLLGLKINNLLTEDNINYVKKLIEDYGLGEFINSYPSSLSGGMKQRVRCMC